MAPLVEASWAKSGRGPNGGYSLLGGVEHVSMLDLIQATEGSFPSDECVLRDGKCSDGETCALHDSWSEVRAAITAQFGDIRVLL
jgi:DNA-binding IscR family transcriptional regulator